MGGTQGVGDEETGRNRVATSVADATHNTKARQMTSAREDREFLDKMMDFLRNDHMLETAIEWIRSNMSPEDVFHERDLESWAEGNG